MENISIHKLISLTGKTAIVTGAAKGIGKAIANRLAEAGSSLLLIDIDEKALKATSDELQVHETRIDYITMDVSQKEAIDRLWLEMDSSSPDILVNNAGMFPFKPFEHTDEELFRKVMAVNLDSAMWMCRHMIEKRKNKGGVIVNVGSIEAILPFKHHLVHYSIAKAGVHALTRSLAKEYASKGFRVNAILPGGIVTPGFNSAAKGLMKLEMGLLKDWYNFKSRLPAGRFGTPDEVARLVLFLCSDMAAYIHGALIPVDGGFLSA